jgi:hypothetical protein
VPWVGERDADQVSQVFRHASWAVAPPQHRIHIGSSHRRSRRVACCMFRFAISLELTTTTQHTVYSQLF